MREISSKKQSTLEQFEREFATLTHLYCHWRLTRVFARTSLDQRIRLEIQRLAREGADEQALNLYVEYLADNRDHQKYERFANYVTQY